MQRAISSTLPTGPDILTYDNARAAGAGLSGGEAILLGAGLTVPFLADFGGSAAALARLDARVAGLLGQALAKDAGVGADFMRAASSLLAAWPQTSERILAHPQARGWVAECNAAGVPLAAHAARWSVGGDGRFMHGLYSLGALPLPDERGLAPWQVAFGRGVTSKAFPKAWWPRQDSGEVERGMAMALNHAWAGGRDREGMMLDDLWRSLALADWNRGGKAAVGADAPAARALLAGHFLRVAMPCSDDETTGRMRRNLGSHGADGALRNLSREEWLAPTSVAPAADGGLREAAEGWPIAGAVMLAYLIGGATRYQMGAASDDADGSRLLDRAMASLAQAPNEVLDRPLAWGPDQSTSLRGLLGLCRLVFHDYFTGFAGTVPRGGWQCMEGAAPFDKATLDAALGGRRLLYGKATRARRALCDHAMLEFLLHGHIGAVKRCTLGNAERVEGALHIIVHGDLERAPDGARGQPMAALLDMESIDKASLHTRAWHCEETFLRALGRLPGALAAHTLQAGGVMPDGRGLRPGVKAGLLLPGGRRPAVSGGWPVTLAIVEAWEQACLARLGAKGMDRKAWTEALGEVFGKCGRTQPGFLASEEAARWLVGRMAGGSVAAANVRVWLPRFLMVLEQRTQPLAPECADAARGWLEACAQSPSGTRAAIVTLEAWCGVKTRRHPGVLFQQGGLGDCSRLRGACEAMLAKDSQTGWTAALLGPWQAVSLAGKGDARPRRRA